MILENAATGRMRLLKVLVLTLSVSIQAGYAQQPRTLDFYIETALANSPLLHEFRNVIAAARLDSALIHTAYSTQVNFTSTNIYSPIIGSNHGFDEAITNGGYYTTVVNASKTLIGRANIGAQYKANRLNADSTLNTTKISEQDIKRTVTAQYLAAYGDQQQIENNVRIHKLLAEEDVALKKLTEHNIYRQTDYLTFAVTLKQQELQQKQLRVQFLADFGNLNYLCGIVDTDASNVILEDPLLSLSTLADPMESAFFYRFILDSIRLQNEVTLIKMSYRPKLTIFSDAGFSSSRPELYLSHYGASAGFNFALPIYDGHRKRLSMLKIDLLEDTRIYTRNYFTAQYNQQIAQFMQQLRATEHLLHDIQEQVDYTAALITANTRLLQTGDVRISDFVIAINNYLTAQYMVTQNRISRYQVINQANYWNR